MRPNLDFLTSMLPHSQSHGIDEKSVANAWIPRVDLSETDVAYVVRLEIPGVEKEDLEVALDGNVLTLSGRRQNPEGKKNERYIWRERKEGHFVRSIRLPDTAEAHEFKATVSDGLLTVHVTKVEPAATTNNLIE
jgi:HSP20 family protein